MEVQDNTLHVKKKEKKSVLEKLTICHSETPRYDEQVGHYEDDEGVEGVDKYDKGTHWCSGCPALKNSFVRLADGAVNLSMRVASQETAQPKPPP